MKEKVLSVLQEINDEIREGVDLIEEEIIDSFEIVNIVRALEEKFDISIEMDEVDDQNFKNVESIVNFVEGKCNGSAEGWTVTGKLGDSSHCD